MAFVLKLCVCLVRRGAYSYVVLAATICGVICSSVGHSFMLAPYNERVCEDLGLSRTYLSSIWAATLFLAAVWLQVVGRLADRCGARRLIFAGGLLQGAALAWFSGARDPWGIALGYFSIRLASVETVDFACRHCLNQWFVKRRGLAAGVLNSLAAVQFLLPAGETLLVGAVGWRATSFGIGIGAAALVIICSGFSLSHPEDYGLEPDIRAPALNDRGRALSTEAVAAAAEEVASEDDSSFTFSEAVRTRVFWALTFCWLCMGIPWAGINFLLVTILEGAGRAQEDAVYVYMSLSVCSFIACVASGRLVDRLPHRRKHASVAAVNACMLATLLTAATLSRLPKTVGPLLLGAWLGMWQGSSQVISTTIMADLFGRRHLGAIRGLWCAFAQLSSASGPIALASARSTGASFESLFCGLAALQVLGILIVCAAPAPGRLGSLYSHSMSLQRW